VAFRSFYNTFSCLIQSVLGVLALHTSHPPATPRPRARFCNALWLRRSFSTRCTEPARCTIACKLSVMTHSEFPNPTKRICLLLQYLSQSYARGGKRIVEKKKYYLLVLNSVTSPPRWIRQPQLHATEMFCAIQRAEGGAVL
jgi:hypothetical protein